MVSQWLFSLNFLVRSIFQTQKNYSRINDILKLLNLIFMHRHYMYNMNSQNISTNIILEI
jgi:hypothetical protein